ncbi:hypothetical protein [Metabacillus sp. Hm71]|uniref:hypothetical protein n=1 Tax=Metabacillus sp. Hm71 TaxID=3450743 RepID=UPI003F432B04
MNRTKWYQRLMCKFASKIINKYDIHHLTIKSHILLDGRIYVITAYNHTDRIDEYPSISLEGVSPTYHLKIK